MKKDKKNEKKKPSFENSISKDAQRRVGINTDPLGSWTGVPENPYEKPVQDADDL